MRGFLKASRISAEARREIYDAHRPSTLSKPRLQLWSHSSWGRELSGEPSGHIFSENCSNVSMMLATISGG